MLESVPLPKLVEEAAIELFRINDATSVEAAVVREALDDLRSRGVLEPVGA